MAANAAAGIGQGLAKVGGAAAKQILLPKHWGRNALILAGCAVGLPALSEAWSVAQAGGAGTATFIQAFTTNVASAGATAAHAAPDALQAVWGMGTSGVEYVGSMPWDQIWTATTEAATSAPTAGL